MAQRFQTNGLPETFRVGDTGTHLILQEGKHLSDGFVMVNKTRTTPRTHAPTGHPINPHTGQVMFPAPAGVGYDQWKNTGPQVFVPLEAATPIPIEPIPSLPPYDTVPEPEDQLPPRPPEPPVEPPPEPEPSSIIYAYVRNEWGEVEPKLKDGVWRLRASEPIELWYGAKTYSFDYLP